MSSRSWIDSVYNRKETMKKILTAILTLFFVCSSSAEKRVNLSVLCEKPDFVQSIIKKHKEDQLFVGQDDIHGVPGMNTLIFLNKETGTYSLLFIVPNTDVICIVGSGIKGRLIYNQ